MSNPQPQNQSESEQPLKKRKSQPSQATAPADEILGRLQFQYLNAEDPFSPEFEKSKLIESGLAREGLFLSKVACEADISLYYSETRASERAKLEVEAAAVSTKKWDLKLKVDLKEIGSDWLGVATCFSGDASAGREPIVEAMLKLKWTVKLSGKVICELEREVDNYFVAEENVKFEHQLMPMLMYKTKKKGESISSWSYNPIIAFSEKFPCTP